METKQLSYEKAYIISAEDGDKMLELLQEAPYKYAVPIISIIAKAVRADMTVKLTDEKTES